MPQFPYAQTKKAYKLLPARYILLQCKLTSKNLYSTWKVKSTKNHYSSNKVLQRKHQGGFGTDGRKSIAFHFKYNMCKSYLLHEAWFM